MKWHAPHLLAAFVVAALTSAAHGADVDYARQIKPLLSEKCGACHGALKQKAGLRLDAAQLIRKGDENGAVIVAGKADQSRLIHAIEGTHDIEKMPKEGAPLTAEQIKLVRFWIDQGAKSPAEEPVPADPKEHWSFKPPMRPGIPKIKNAAWVRNPIDALVAAEHERRGLSPLAEAPRATLLRRLYVDLAGVPPTVAELRAFLADDSPQAYEKVVDRLLADPRYGQRWGRHWMDVWRYSDWAGYKAEVRDSRPGIWRWRDWIIESLNEDRPYDQMVRLMLAADELCGTEGSESDLRAGGYLARSWYKFNRNVWLDNTVEHSSKAFLGLTLNCAKCHDHKYDPLSQAEYYQFRAIFEPLDVRNDPAAGAADPERDGLPLVYDKDPKTPTYLFKRGDEKNPDKSRELPPGAPAALGKGLAINPIDLSPVEFNPGRREAVRKQRLESAQQAVTKAREELGKIPPETSHEYTVKAADAKLHAAELELAATQAVLAADEAKDAADLAHALQTGTAAATAQRLAARATAQANLLVAERDLIDARIAPKTGNAKAAAALDATEKKLPSLRKAVADAAAAPATQPAAKYAPLTTQYPQTSTGRRTALAKWITARQNPLAARVAINHIWMRHFGEPLVPTVFDFGINGKPPTNPQLLDWLAVELMENGWSMKQIHRLIVTSATYRMASTPAADDPAYAANLKIDPDNHLNWRATVRRMEAEAVRDSVLAVAGNLDIAAGGTELDQDSWQTSTRRSLYYRHANDKQSIFMQVFDAPSPNECYRRVETVTPQQSLALANSPLALTASRKLAAELSGEVGAAAEKDETFIAAAYERVLCRPPASDERDACVEFLHSQAKLLTDAKNLTPFVGTGTATVKPAADPRQRARENLVHVLLNHNDFATVR
jgi:hypothetical protein